MPPRDSFIDTENSTATENYYSTLHHEIGHWSGAAHRLDRKLANGFGKPEYAFEELIAELSAAFVNAYLGIAPTPRADHALYLNNWMQALKDNERAIFKASAEAQKVLNYVIELQPQSKESE